MKNEQDVNAKLVEALQEMVTSLNATEFPMGVWERAQLNMLNNLRDSLRKAEQVLASLPEPPKV